MFLVLLLVLMLIGVVVWVYVFALKKSTGINHRILQLGGVMVVVLVVNFFVGYKLSPTYELFNRTCETIVGVVIEQVTPTHSPYTQDCLRAPELLQTHQFQSVTCDPGWSRWVPNIPQEQRNFIRLTLNPDADGECGSEVSEDDWKSECFSSANISLPENYYEYRKLPEEVFEGSFFFSQMVSKKVEIVRRDGKPIAHTTEFFFHPYGNGDFSKLLKSLGGKRERSCGTSINAYKVIELFPPIPTT